MHQAKNELVAKVDSLARMNCLEQRLQVLEQSIKANPPVVPEIENAKGLTFF